jgi:hypothetical protein
LVVFFNSTRSNGCAVGDNPVLGVRGHNLELRRIHPTLQDQLVVVALQITQKLGGFKELLSFMINFFLYFLVFIGIFVHLFFIHFYEFVYRPVGRVKVVVHSIAERLLGIWRTVDALPICKSETFIQSGRESIPLKCKFLLFFRAVFS